MSILSPTPLDKLVARTRLPWIWFVAITGAALFVLPFAVASLDGFTEEFIYQGVWRRLLLAPAVIVYILAIYRPLERYLIRAIEALRQLIMLDNDAFDRLVQAATEVDDRVELAAFSVGAIFGFLSGAPWQITENYPYLKIYLPFANALMFGLLGWIIVSALVSTRLQSTLHKQPLKIDIFDTRPFEPIGYYSLFVALAFVGGSVISVILVNPLAEGLDVLSIAVYGIMAAVAVLVFFLGMQPTHRVLADTKAQELAEVERNISATLRPLTARKTEGLDIGKISTELNLWIKYEERLKRARTWPYNTGMLRTIFLSVLFPPIASLAQRFVVSLLIK